MNTEELKNKVIEKYKEMTQSQEELNRLNEKIIQHQKEHIVILEDNINELKQIIEKYLLKTTPDDRDNNRN